MKILVFLALVACAYSTHAATNLPIVCTGTVVGTTCSTSTTATTAYGAAGKVFATPSGAWKEWSKIGVGETVRVCPSDVTPGVVCPVNRISVVKTLAAVTPPVTSWNIAYVWTPPTQSTDGIGLPAGEITGYILQWHYYVDDTLVEVQLGNVLNYTLQNLNRKVVCARLIAVGKSGTSEPTAELCIDPPAQVIVPKPPASFFGTPA